MKHSGFALVIFLLFTNLCCNDEPFDPIVYGALEGQVLNDPDRTALAEVYVTTIPSSGTYLSDNEGRFKIDKLATGEYDVIVEKDGYLQGRATANILEDETTDVIVLMKERIEDNSPPTLPSDPIPQNLSIDIKRNVLLKWKASDENSDDTLKYTVQIHREGDNEFQSIATLQTADSLLLNDLSYATNYYWQVIVSDNVNEPTYGPIWQFKTEVRPVHRILFVRLVQNVYQLFSGDEDQNELQITYSTNHVFRPRQNPQRTKIAFISNDGIENHLYTINPDGTEFTKVTAQVPIQFYDNSFGSYCWTPNGANLIYSNYNRLFSISKDGSGLVMLTEFDNNLSINYVDWNASSNQIIIRVGASNNYDGEIYAITPLGIITDTLVPQQNGRTGGGMFAPDGINMCFTQDSTGYQDATGRQLDSRIYIINLNDKIITDYSGKYKPNGSNDLDPRFSPNGAFIIFVNTSNDGVSEKNIYKIDMDGQRTLLFQNAEMPDWM